MIYEGTREFEKVEFQKGEGEPAALTAAFATSRNFTAKKLADGDGSLAAVAQAAMTPGENPTVTNADYSDGLAALEAVKWNLVCVDTEEPAVHALLAAYLDRCERAGMFPLACVAETKAVDLEQRMAHAAAFNDNKIHYVLNPAELADGTACDGYRLAGRIGGMIAAAQANESLTHQVVSGFAGLAEPLTNSQVEKALSMGCLCLTQNAGGQIWIESGINTLVAPAGNQDEGWKKIRRTKTRFETMERVIAVTDPLVGRVNNDANGRATLIAAAQGVLNTMIGEGKLRAGTISEDKSNSATGDSAWFILAVDDLDSVEKVYLVFRFRFSPEA